ncbi:Nuclease-related domain-containing protein [Bacillus sp. 491mf]|uniref:nuclease-related domain-containing protein n=1 Tax=Bacillus TaxID=1386 RepID=UPI000551844F|nr:MULTISPECIES: nuclease-related domain-containing protein [unclassified Bacillus (in: firmicutes)]SFD57651.1 Nuclease-related domain-containing protein [Bacillus sp. 491mf]
MIVKERKIPIYLRQLEALFRRVPVDHPKRNAISKNLAKHKAGYKGEQAIDYPLSFLPNKEYSILHDIRLFDQDHYFQMDTLILSSRFILLLEIKNIAGTLLFDSEFSQLIRISEQKSEGFPDPILQMKRQERQLQKWLHLYGFLALPIESFVVISTPRTIIKTSSHDQDFSKNVIHSANLPNKIEDLERMHVEILSSKDIQELALQMMMNHSPLQRNVLEQYHVTKHELLKGVHCPVCSYLPTMKVKNGWHCLNCNSVSKFAHKDALQDYALLLGTTVTNQGLKEFLHITSSSVIKRLVHAMNLPYKGEKKGRKYDLTGIIQ